MMMLLLPQFMLLLVVVNSSHQEDNVDKIRSHVEKFTREVSKMIDQFSLEEHSFRTKRQADGSGIEPVLRRPELFQKILRDMSNATGVGEFGFKVTNFVRFFWYGRWCGAGHGKDSSTDEQAIELARTKDAHLRKKHLELHNQGHTDHVYLPPSERHECQCDCPNPVPTHLDIYELLKTVTHCNAKCPERHPIDDIDVSCQFHDMCYSCARTPLADNAAFCGCEQAISEMAKRADCDVHEYGSLAKRWCLFYRQAIPFIFSMKPCYCPTLKQIRPWTKIIRPENTEMSSEEAQRKIVLGFPHCREH